MSDPNSADAPLTPEARAMIGAGAPELPVLDRAADRRPYRGRRGDCLQIVAAERRPRRRLDGGRLCAGGGEGAGGREVISAVAADGKLTVTFRNGATTSIRIFDGTDRRDDPRSSGDGE